MPTKTSQGLQERASRMLEGGTIGQAARRRLSPLLEKKRSQMARGQGLMGGYPFTPTLSASKPSLGKPPATTGLAATPPMAPAPAPKASMAVAPSGQEVPGMAGGMSETGSITDAIKRATQLTDALPDDLRTGLEITALAKAMGRIMGEGNAIRNTRL